MKKKNKNKDKNNNNEDTRTKSELLEELAGLNQSISLTYIAIIAILLNLTFNYNERTKIIDELRGTPTTIDSSTNHKNLVFSRQLALFVAIISFKDSVDQLDAILCSYPIDKKEVEAANRVVIISALALYASALSLYNTLVEDADIFSDVPVV